MKTLTLGCHGIVVEVHDAGGGTIESDLRRDKPTEKETLQSQDWMAWIQRCIWNRSVDAIESVILAHACAGIDVIDPKYVEGVESACDAISNHLGE